MYIFFRFFFVFLCVRFRGVEFWVSGRVYVEFGWVVLIVFWKGSVSLYLVMRRCLLLVVLSLLRVVNFLDIC